MGSLNHLDKVAQNVKKGAETYGRVYALMYDTSKYCAPNDRKWVDVLKNDWMHLVDDLKYTDSDRYLKHKGKPIVALWGIDPDRCTASHTLEIIDWFKNKAPEKYRATLMCGTPDNDWRSRTGDWAKVYNSFDVMSPWAVGRYKDIGGADTFKKKFISPEVSYCASKNMDYMPVIFPGFSWKNHRGGMLNSIPRNGGKFYWRQSYNAISAGVKMIYIAMFDEVDEGTAMFKIAPKRSMAPSGSWITLDADGLNLPSDWYLRLASETGQVLRKEKSNSDTVPSNPGTTVISNPRVTMTSPQGDKTPKPTQPQEKSLTNTADVPKTDPIDNNTKTLIKRLIEILDKILSIFG
jgi:hypothetical protein